MAGKKSKKLHANLCGEFFLKTPQNMVKIRSPQKSAGGLGRDDRD